MSPDPLPSTIETDAVLIDEINQVMLQRAQHVRGMIAPQLAILYPENTDLVTRTLEVLTDLNTIVK